MNIIFLTNFLLKRKPKLPVRLKSNPPHIRFPISICWKLGTQSQAIGLHIYKQANGLSLS